MEVFGQKMNFWNSVFGLQKTSQNISFAFFSKERQRNLVNWMELDLSGCHLVGHRKIHVVLLCLLQRQARAAQAYVVVWKQPEREISLPIIIFVVSTLWVEGLIIWEIVGRTPHRRALCVCQKRLGSFACFMHYWRCCEAPNNLKSK